LPIFLLRYPLLHTSGLFAPKVSPQLRLVILLLRVFPFVCCLMLHIRENKRKMGDVGFEPTKLRIKSALLYRISLSPVFTCQGSTLTDRWNIVKREIGLLKKYKLNINLFFSKRNSRRCDDNILFVHRIKGEIPYVTTGSKRQFFVVSDRDIGYSSHFMPAVIVSYPHNTQIETKNGLEFFNIIFCHTPYSTNLISKIIKKEVAYFSHF
jgi:hypothetical protein